MTWAPATLRDTHGDLRRVRCGCGRQVWNEEMIDLRKLPASERPRGDEFVCDGCWQRLDPMHQRRHDILKRLGAPASVVTEIQLAHAPRRD